MNHLKDDHSFFDGLVHLQLAKKLSRVYKPIAEEKIEGKPLDALLPGKNSDCIIEVTSIDMYQRLKNTSSVVQNNDKVEPIFIKKTEETSEIPKIKDPIIISIDVSRSPELISALKEYKTITEVRLDDNKMVIKIKWKRIPLIFAWIHPLGYDSRLNAIYNLQNWSVN